MSVHTYCSFMKRFLFLAALGLVTSLGYAQSPASGGPTPQSTTAVPLDGGASLLLASGVAYGLRRLRRRRQQA